MINESFVIDVIVVYLLMCSLLGVYVDIFIFTSEKSEYKRKEVIRIQTYYLFSLLQILSVYI